MIKAPDTEFIKEVNSLIINFIKDNYKDIKSISSIPNSNTIKHKFDLSLGKKHSLRDMKNFVEQYLKFSVKTGNIHFYNQLFSGFSMMGYTGEAITAVTNSSMYTYEMSPIATLMEKELIKKMSLKIGYEEGDGTFVTGGSNGNFIAMLAARHRYQPYACDIGLQNQNQLVGFISQDAHYSLLKAANHCGIGTNNMIQIPVDENGRMIIDKLEQSIINVKKDGNIPFFVAATAGTTVRGIFDPINQIGDLCAYHNIWFHVDASWGGSLLLSDKYRYLLSGCDKSDSFSWCAHKMLGAPITCSALIVKDKSILKIINNVSGTDYLFHDKSNLDLGHSSLQCGRRTDSLKLWLIWKYIGDSELSIKINYLIKLAKYAEKLVNESPILHLIQPVESLNICFYIKPQNLSTRNLNHFNILIRNKLISEKGIMVNYAKINKKTCLRLITTNFDSTEKHLDQFFKDLHSLVEKQLQD